MAILNKVTKLRTPGTLTEEVIQLHIDEQNVLGYHLVAVDNLVGFYRMFWEKEEIAEEPPPEEP